MDPMIQLSCRNTGPFLESEIELVCEENTISVLMKDSHRNHWLLKEIKKLACLGSVDPKFIYVVSHILTVPSTSMVVCLLKEISDVLEV